MALFFSHIVVIVVVNFLSDRHGIASQTNRLHHKVIWRSNRMLWIIDKFVFSMSFLLLFFEAILFAVCAGPEFVKGEMLFQMGEKAKMHRFYHEKWMVHGNGFLNTFLCRLRLQINGS